MVLEHSLTTPLHRRHQLPKIPQYTRHFYEQPCFKIRWCFQAVRFETLSVLFAYYSVKVDHEIKDHFVVDSTYIYRNRFRFSRFCYIFSMH